MKYTKTHEWIMQEGNIGTVGVTEYAQKELGDIVYVELPKLQSKINLGDDVAVLESTKAAADIYSPVSGTIIEVNQELVQNAGLINTSPEKQGWIFKIELANIDELKNLMNEAEYKTKN